MSLKVETWQLHRASSNGMFQSPESESGIIIVLRRKKNVYYNVSRVSCFIIDCSIRMFFNGSGLHCCTKGTVLELGPWPEEGSVLHVGLVGGVGSPLLHALFLQDGDSTDVAQQEPQEQRGHHAEVLVPAHDRGGRHEQPSPLQDLPTVVRVAAQGPQATLDELALVDEEMH